MTTALDGLRVLDLGGTVATAYCGKLFADYGADVVLAEPAAGHAIRTLPPIRDGASAYAAYLSARKRSVNVDDVEPLVARADVVLLGPSPDARLDVWAVRHPGVVFVAITWFGLTGPCRDWAGSDGVVQALIGLVRGIGPPSGPPLVPSGFEAQIVGGLTAYVAALGRLLGRDGGHGGGVVDVSILEANLCFTEPGAVAAYHLPPTPLPRLGINRLRPTFPMGIYPCKDGWIGVTALTPAQWLSLCELLDMRELAQEPRYRLTVERMNDADRIEAEMKPRFLARTAAEWFHRGQAMRIPLALVPTTAELPEVDQYAARGAFVTIEDGRLGEFTAPNTPFRLFATPPAGGGRAPGLGADTAAVLSDWRQRPHPAARSDTGTRAAMLSNVRVVDLSMGWAGPLAARHLADLGAEVIKVEACQRFDWWRGWDVTPAAIAANAHELAASFNMVNRNKLGITLDITTTRGRVLLLRLVARADVVIENYSGEVLEKLALGYEQLRAVKPDLVMVSMPAFGTTGTWRGYRAYGSTVEQASGLPHLNGEAGWPPPMQHVALGDAVGGINGAAAALTALVHRARTGQGQYADLSQAECLFPLGAHGIVEQSLTGRAPARRGSRREDCCPSGAFPCAGDDAWVVVQARSREEWRALCECIGRPAWHGFDLAERLGREREIEVVLAAWTRTRTPAEAMRALQAAGVPAGAAFGGADVLVDAHLGARDFWQFRERAFVGRSPNPSPPYRFGATPLPVAWPAPTLGQHNARVLGDLLGLTAAELEALEAATIIGTRPIVG